MVLFLEKHTPHAMDAARLCAHPVLADHNCRSIIEGESGILAITSAAGGALAATLWFTESLRGSLNRFKVAQNASMGALPTKLFSEN
jgi:hypothetical protein